MCSNLVKADLQSAHATIEHKYNICTVAASANIVCMKLALGTGWARSYRCRRTGVEKLLRPPDALTDELVAQLQAVHDAGFQRHLYQ